LKGRSHGQTEGHASPSTPPRAGGQKENWRSKGSGSKPSRIEESFQPEADGAETPGCREIREECPETSPETSPSRPRREASSRAEAAGRQGLQAGPSSSGGKAGGKGQARCETSSGCESRSRQGCKPIHSDPAKTAKPGP